MKAAGFTRASTAARVPAPGQVLLSTWLASRRQVDWVLEPAGAIRMPEGARGLMVLFHPEAVRVVSVPLTDESAKSHVLRAGHAQERVRVVNRTRTEGVIHAAPVRLLDSLLEGSGRRKAIDAVAPGLLLADRLRSDAATRLPTTGPHAVLLDLGAPGRAEGRFIERLVIAVVYRHDDLPPAITCSLTAEPVEAIARLVLYEHRVADDAPWKVFGPEQVLAACVDLPSWPLEPEWAGVPLRRLRLAATVACALLAAASLSRAVVTAWSIAAIARESAQWRDRVGLLHEAIAARLAEDPRGFARVTGLDPSDDLDRAHALWREGTRVSVEASLQRSAYTVTLPLLRPATTSGGRAAPPVVAGSDRIDPLFAFETQPGCSPVEARIRGGLDEMAMVMVCTRRDSRLSALLPR